MCINAKEKKTKAGKKWTWGLEPKESIKFTTKRRLVKVGRKLVGKPSGTGNGFAADQA